MQNKLDELTAARDAAEQAFRAATSSETFNGTCEQLRTAGSELSDASAVVQSTEEEILTVDTDPHSERNRRRNAEHGTLMERARRVSIGIPTLNDLRQVIMFDPRNIESPGSS